jgi:hypothetical protein
MRSPLKKVLLGDAAGLRLLGRLGRSPFPRNAWARGCVKAGLYVEKPDPKQPRRSSGSSLLELKRHPGAHALIGFASPGRGKTPRCDGARHLSHRVHKRPNVCCLS